jgi:hypothetical protein
MNQVGAPQRDAGAQKSPPRSLTALHQAPRSLDAATLRARVPVQVILLRSLSARRQSARSPSSCCRRCSSIGSDQVEPEPDERRIHRLRRIAGATAA